MSEFKLEVPHNPAEEYHEWVYLPGFTPRGGTEPIPAVVHRDAIGRKRRYSWKTWLVVACNNSQCPARAIVRDSVLLDAVTEALPMSEGSRNE